MSAKVDRCIIVFVAGRFFMLTSISQQSVQIMFSAKVDTNIARFITAWFIYDSTGGLGGCTYSPRTDGRGREGNKRNPRFQLTMGERTHPGMDCHVCIPACIITYIIMRIYSLRFDFIMGLYIPSP